MSSSDVMDKAEDIGDKKTKYISVKDVRIILTVIAALLLFIVCYIHTRGNGNTVIITHNGKELSRRYSLNTDRTIKIRNDNGKITNVVRIKNGKVYMESADCPDKICIHQGKKSKDGESITCLPNRVVVEVKGEDRSDMDTMTK